MASVSIYESVDRLSARFKENTCAATKFLLILDNFITFIPFNAKLPALAVRRLFLILSLLLLTTWHLEPPNSTRLRMLGMPNLIC
jgi:hypothetical protein